MTKARDIADFKFENITDTGTEGTKVASGTTAQRGSTTGQFRYNSTTGKFEGRNASDFVSIEPTPVVSSVNNNNITQTQIDAGFDLVITGSNFATGDTVKFIGNDNTEYTSPTVAVNSSSQITARVTTSIDITKEPFDVSVTSSGGLTGSLNDAFNVNASPTFATASGSLGNVVEDVAISGSLNASATDPEGSSVTHSISSGALPTGLSIASATGLITGTPNVNDSFTAGGITHNFTVSATDGTNTSSRAFSILRTWQDGSSAAAVANSAKAIKDLTGTTTSGLYYINVSGQGAVQVYCDMSMSGGGWTLVYKAHHVNQHNWIHPSVNTYYALNYDPRSHSNLQSEGNLPNKYSDYGATSGAAATEFVLEGYYTNPAGVMYAYKYGFTSSVGSTWENGNNSMQTNFIPASLSYTQITDNCSSQNGTRPTSDSMSGGNRFTDKASPGSTGNWDIGGFKNGDDSQSKANANCAYNNGSSTGWDMGNATTLLWVR